MNTIYRIVWNRASGKWGASEQAKGCNKKSNSLHMTALVAALVLSAPMVASATTESCMLQNGVAGVIDAAGECVAGKSAHPGAETHAPISPNYSDGGGNDNGDATSVVIGQGATGGLAGGKTNAVAIGINASTGANDSAIAIGNYAQASQYSATAIGNRTMATGTGATAVGRESFAGADYSTAMGNLAQATGQSAIAIGDTNSANGQDAISVGTAARSTGNGATAVGSGSTATSTNALAMGANASAKAERSVAVGSGANATGTEGHVSGGGIPGYPGTSITNTALGANAMADNGSTAMGDHAKATGVASTAVGPYAVASGNLSAATGFAAQATGLASTALGVTAQAIGDQSVALGYGSVADRAHTLSVGAAGKERQITNVAAGTHDTDAVNLAQLKAMGLVDPIGNPLAAVAYDDIGLGKITLGGMGGTLLGNLQGGLIAAGSMEAINGGQLWDMQQKFQGQFNDLSDRVDELAAVGLGPGPSPGPGPGPVDPSMPGTGENSTAVGADASASGSSSTAMGTGAKASGDNSTATGAGAMASGNNSVALGSGSVADRDNSVSVGSAGNERQITNVAAGTQRTDAANWGQVQDAVSGVKDWANQKFNQVDRRINGMGAMSAAYGQMAFSAQGINTPNKVGMGVGTMNGQSAIAVGYSRQIRPNMNISFGGSASANDASVGAGFSVGW